MATRRRTWRKPAPSHLAKAKRRHGSRNLWQIAALGSSLLAAKFSDQTQGIAVVASLSFRGESEKVEQNLDFSAGWLVERPQIVRLGKTDKPKWRALVGNDRLTEVVIGIS